MQAWPFQRCQRVSRSKPADPLERGDAREQDHLEEREVGAPEAGQPADRREEIAGRVHGEIAAVHPEPGDGGAVAGDEHGDHDRGGTPAHDGCPHRRAALAADSATSVIATT